MAALDFPASPTIGDIYTTAAGSWEWNGESWISLGVNLTIYDEGVPLANAATGLNFTGTPVTASGTGPTKIVNVTGTGGGGGALQGVEFTTPGAYTFNVPTGVTGVWITMIGAGAGGASRTGALGGGAGGAGEYCQMVPLKVTSGGTVTGVVGAGGAGAAAGAGANPGAAGGSSTAGPFTVLGGEAGQSSNSFGGGGGGPGGAAAAGIAGAIGAGESILFWGGGSGGAGGTTTATDGKNGCPSGGILTGALGGTHLSSQAGGGGGASSIYGLGGDGGDGGSPGVDATSYGTGGGGAGGLTGNNGQAGNGADGYVLIMYVGP